MSKPKFNPDAPFEPIIESKPKFDSSKSFEPIATDQIRSPASQQDFSELESAGLGLLGSASFDLADELEGALKAPMGGGKALLRLLGKDYAGDPDVQAYDLARDIARERAKAAMEANPASYIGGTLAGSLVPGAAITKLIGPAAKGLKLAKGIEGPINKANFLQRLKNAGEIGAISGAAYGLGGSEKETLPEVLSETGEGTAVGTGIGLGIETGLSALGAGGKVISSGAKSLGKLRTVQRAKEAFGFGKEGIDIVSQEGLKKAGEELVTGVESLGLLGKNALKKAGDEYGSAQKGLEKAGKTYDIQDNVNIVKNALKELKKSRDPAAESDIKNLQNILDNFEKGKLETVEISLLKPRTLESSPSSRQKLEDEAIKVKEAARQLGQNVDTKIVESSDDKGRKLLTLIKSTDENIGSGERLIPGEPIQIVDELIPTPNDVNKVKFQTSDNSPESKMKALEKAAKLNSKAKTEGKIADYKVVEDRDHGLYNVVETTKGDLPSPKMGEGSPELFVDPSLNFKTQASAKTIIDQPPPQGAFIPTTPTLEQVRTGPVDFSQASPQETRDLIATFNRLSGVKGNAPITETDIATNALKRSAGSMKEQLKASPEFDEANKLWAAGKQAFEELRISEKDFIKDAATGEFKLNPSARSKLINEVRSAGTETSAGITSGERLKNVLRLLNEIAPEEVKQLGPELEKKAKVLDLARFAQGAQFTKSSIFSRGPVQAGNRLGLGIKSLKNKNPEFWNSIGQKMEDAGGEAARFGKFLKNAASKDEAARNALLFSLQQQPWAREVMNKWFEKEENK